jgi:CRP/FNR family cyclic AMP-dependent transcriptional regulator
MDGFTRIIEESIWGRLLERYELERVLATASERKVAAHGYVARMGEPATHWIGLAEGLLKMSVAAADGRVSTLTGVSTAAWFGEGSLIKRENRRYDVIALRPSRLVLVPQATFEWLRGRSLPFNHYLQNLLNARLGLFIGMLEYGRLLDADARVARCLAALFNTDLYPDPPPFVDLRQGEIALLCGLSRQRVNLALQRLADAGHVRIESRGLTVLDVDGLRGFAAGGPARRGGQVGP